MERGMSIKIGIASLIGIALLLAWFAKPQPFAKVLADSRIPLRRDTQTNGVWVKLDDEAALMNALHRAGYACSQTF